jgi:glucose/arabinose dehydrogenase
VVLAGLLAASPALAAAPSKPVITEPASEGQVVHPADVHMVAMGFSDPDGDEHLCSDWEILKGAAVVWEANCAADTEKVHIHLGDGSFVGAYAGHFELEYGAEYTLRVRFRDDDDGVGPFAEREFATYPTSFAGGDVTWTPTQPGFVVEEVAGGLQLPVNVAFIPDPGPLPGDPLAYVTELYGTVKVLTRDHHLLDYATGLLNFDPIGNFPGSGEQGLTGIVVDPASGDLFVSLVYEASPGGPHYAEVLRLESSADGLSAVGQSMVRDMAGELVGPSHQVSNLTIGPDGKLYVHNGDGMDPSTALDLDSYRGKILRMNLDGSAPSDNPFYTAGPEIARDFVYAYGFRNPFGGAWRASNGAHYELENGPSTDRLARVEPGAGYGWNGYDETMSTGALATWNPAHAPVNLAFVEPQTFEGSGFPASRLGDAFVTESGPTYAWGPQGLGKRIVEFPLAAGAEPSGHPVSLLEYTGTGRATAVGLAAGPDGLYFTELYRDHGELGPTEPGARLMRLRYVGTPACTIAHRRLKVSIPRGRHATIKRRGNGSIAVDGRSCGKTLRRLDSIAVKGARGNERLVLDLRGGRLGPGATRERRGSSEIEVMVALGRGRRDTLVVRGSGRPQRPGGRGVRLDADLDLDVFTRGIERFRLSGL